MHSYSEQVSLPPADKGFVLDPPQTFGALSDGRAELLSTVSPLDRVNVLTQAYVAAVHLQNVLKPLVPRTTWHQATDVAGRGEGHWPIQERTCTVMFTDITSFTALVEAHPVREVLESLNDYIALLSEIVQRHRGEVHKFLGDGLMALFDDPADAVQAGCEIQRAVAEFNARQEARGLWRFETRLAIDTGEVVLASVGSPDRQDYTVIGRPVNRAAHLSERAVSGTVWISHRTYEHLSDQSGFVSRTSDVVRTRECISVVYEKACLY